MKNPRKEISLEIRANLFNPKEEKLPDGMVYVYTHGGKYIASAELKRREESLAKIKIPEEYLGQKLKIISGPVVSMQMEGETEVPLWMRTMLQDQGEFPKAPAPTTLKRLGAVEKRITLEKENSLIETMIYPHDWLKWLTCYCLVRGRLVKKVPMPDGTTQDWGVCHACILIYEVDAFPMIITKLPEIELWRLRDDLIKIIDRPVIPPPPPPFERLIGHHAMGEALENETIEAEVVYDPALESILSATSTSHLRSELVAMGPHIIKYLCVLPWFMSWFKKDLIKCTCTDETGYFETVIPYPCIGDHPDLYFVAKQCIGGSLHVLYDPGVRCHTWWNYNCGTEVTLVTDDPAAKVCVQDDPVNPPAGVSKYILINKIGGYLINDVTSEGYANYVKNIGSVPTNFNNAPFGATLGFRTSHSPDIPSTNIKYYRWLYNMDGDTHLGQKVWREFGTPVAPSVGRHYADYDLTQPTKPPTFPIYTLGPKSVAGKTMYEFRPTQSEIAAMAPAGHKYEWPVDPVGNDIYSALINSINLPGGPEVALGKYWFKLEVYDSAGVQVLPGTGIYDFIVLTNNSGDTRLPATGEIENGGFVFCLHIDNRHCNAVIETPGIGTVIANPNCGFLEFLPSDSVSLDFNALHPANHARFRFSLIRGANHVTGISPVKDEVDATGAGSWSGNGHGIFKATFSPATLLDTCSQAAFSENLYVYAKAYNGWDRLSGYDASDVWAFALSPA